MSEVNQTIDELFNNPTISTERAYGSWIRALSCKKLSRVGGQWLRSSNPGQNSDSQNWDDDGYENVIPNFQATDDHVEGRDTHRGTVSCGMGGTKGATVNIGRELISTTALHDFSNIAVTNFIAAKHGCCTGHRVAEMAEAIGIREVLSWLKDYWSNSNVSLETNSLLVIKALRGKLMDNSYVSDVIMECRNLLEYLPNMSCSFIKRSANSVALVLARASYSMSGAKEWRDDPPLFICNELQFDLLY